MDHSLHSQQMANLELKCSVSLLRMWHRPHLKCEAEKAQKILVRLFVFKNTPYDKPKNSTGNKTLEKQHDWLSKLCYFNSSTLFYQGKQTEHMQL